MAFYYEHTKSAYTFKIGNQPLWLAPLFRLFRIQSKPIPLIELIEQYSFVFNMLETFVILYGQLLVVFHGGDAGCVGTQQI